MMIFSTSLNDNMSIQKSSLKKKNWLRLQALSLFFFFMMIFSTSLNDNMSIQKSSLKKKNWLRLQALSLFFFFRNTKKFWPFSITFMSNYNTA